MTWLYIEFSIRSTIKWINQSIVALFSVYKFSLEPTKMHVQIISLSKNMKYLLQKLLWLCACITSKNVYFIYKHHVKFFLLLMFALYPGQSSVIEMYVKSWYPWTPRISWTAGTLGSSGWAGPMVTLPWVRGAGTDWMSSCSGRTPHHTQSA